MRSSILGVFAALSLLAPAPLVMGQSLLANGGFESPTVPAAGFKVFVAGDDIGGWTAQGSQVAVTSTTFTQNGFSFVSQEGNQWADLSGFSSNTVEGVEQSAATIAGAQYDLRFWVGNVVDASGTFGSSSTVNVYINGAFQKAFTNSNGTGSTTQNWQEFSYLFTAAGGSTLVGLTNGDPGSDNDNGLDNVTLIQTGSTLPPAVPLPSALAQASVLGLLLAGGLAVGRMRKMRAM